MKENTGFSVKPTVSVTELAPYLSGAERAIPKVIGYDVPSDAFGDPAEQNQIRGLNKTAFEQVVTGHFKERVDSQPPEEFSQLARLRQQAIECGMPSLLLPFADARVFTPDFPTPEFYKLTEARRGVAILLPQYDRSRNVKGVWDAYLIYQHVDGRNGGSDSHLMGPTDEDPELLDKTVAHALDTGSHTICSKPISNLDIAYLRQPWNDQNAERFHDLTHASLDELAAMHKGDEAFDAYARGIAQKFSLLTARRLDLPFDGFGPVTLKSGGGQSFASMLSRHGRRPLVERSDS